MCYHKCMKNWSPFHKFLRISHIHEEWMTYCYLTLIEIQVTHQKIVFHERIGLLGAFLKNFQNGKKGWGGADFTSLFNIYI